MYIQLVDKHGFKSPLLYIHADEDEFMNEVGKWKEGLLEWVKDPIVQGLPLGRLEAETCIVDLMRHLTKFYVDSLPPEHGYIKGRIIGTFRLLNETYLDGMDHEVVEIKTYE